MWRSAWLRGARAEPWAWRGRRQVALGGFRGHAPGALAQKCRCRVGRAVAQLSAPRRSGQADNPRPALPPSWLHRRNYLTAALLILLVTCRATSRRWTSVLPRKLTPTRAALLSRVQGVPSSPDVFVRLQPSDSLPPSATAPEPFPMAYLTGVLSSAAFQADDTCTHRVVRRNRSPALRHHQIHRERRRRPARARPFVRAIVRKPHRDKSASSPRNAHREIFP